MKKHGDREFVLVAMPFELLEDFDVVRDAIVTYMPGYDKYDFKILREALDWVDNLDQAVCVSNKK